MLPSRPTVHAKNPERVRLGRLGALTVHALGKTNTAPARAAWLATIVAEIDPDGSLAPAELERRMQYAMRARMTRLAMTRWGKKRAEAASQTATSAESEVQANARSVA